MATRYSAGSSKPYWKKLYTKEMLQDIKRRFPDLLSHTYCIPNELYYKLKFRSSRGSQITSWDPLEVEIGFDSDLRSSRSEVLVRQCLSRLAARLQDPMIVLFSYDFTNFLNKDLQTCSSQHVSRARPLPQCPFHTARELFPSPDDCSSLQTNKSKARAGAGPRSTGRSKPVRGDFDVLIVSRKYGVVVMEIKSVGDCSVIPNGLDQVRTVTDHEIREKVRKAVVDQLPKSKEVLRHLFSDISKDISVVKVLAVPCLKRSRLRNAVEGDEDLWKKFSSCLTDCPNDFQADIPQEREKALKQLDEALKHCLCEEEIGPHRDLCERAAIGSDQEPAQDERLKSWWEGLTQQKTLNECEFQDVPSTAMSDDVYFVIMSRFCGMYSTVAVDTRKDHRDEVRTVDECIHLTGVRFGRNILFPAQKTILDRQDRFLCLTGTPGSGKTLTLGLKAVEWVKAGHHVIIVCVERVQYGTLVSLTLAQQVTGMVQGHTDTVHVERVSLETNVETAVDTLLKKHKEEGIKFIIDEIPVVISGNVQSKKLNFSVTRLQDALTLFQKLLLSAQHHPGDICPESGAVATAHSLDILKIVEKDLSLLAARVKSFQVAGSGNFLPILDDEWTKSLKQIEKLHDEHKRLLQSLYPMSQDLDEAEGFLGEIHTHLQAALGSLYNLYTSLYSLVIHKLMEVLKKKHEDGNADVSVWTSCMFPSDVPRGYENATFDLCVRCPPTIQTLLELLDKDLPEQMKSASTYLNVLSAHNPPLPSTGQEIKLLDHRDHQTRVTEVHDCAQCGQALSSYLGGTLHIGRGSPLKPHDIIISGSPVEGNKDCAFLQELKQTFNIKLQYTEDEKPPPYENLIFVTGGSVLQGLESKIVVYVPKVKFALARLGEGLTDQEQRPDLPGWLQDLGKWNRGQLWFVASRALSHLIVFVCSRPRQGEDC